MQNQEGQENILMATALAVALMGLLTFYCALCAKHNRVTPISRRSSSGSSDSEDEISSSSADSGNNPFLHRALSMRQRRGFVDGLNDENSVPSSDTASLPPTVPPSYRATPTASGRVTPSVLLPYPGTQDSSEPSVQPPGYTQEASRPTSSTSVISSAAVTRGLRASSGTSALLPMYETETTER